MNVSGFIPCMKQNNLFVPNFVQHFFKCFDIPQSTYGIFFFLSIQTMQPMKNKQCYHIYCHWLQLSGILESDANILNCAILCITDTVILFSFQIGNANIVFCKVNRQISQFKNKKKKAYAMLSLLYSTLWPLLYCKTIISWLVLLFALIICKGFKKNNPI